MGKKITRDEDLMTPSEFLVAVNKLEPGNMLEYYRGYLPVNKTRPKRKLGEVAMLAAEHGLILLISKKLGFQSYIYYAIRSKNGKLTPQLTRSVKTLETKR